MNNKRGSNTSSTESHESLFEGMDEDDDRRSLMGQSLLPPCPPNSKIDESIGYSQETKVQFVVDAVYAFAQALHAAWIDLCRGKQRVCKELKEMDGGEFYKKYLLKVNFTGESSLFLLEFSQVRPFLGMKYLPWIHEASCI